MQQEVEALLALQDDDLKIREIEDQIRSLDPQLAEFDRKREQAAAALTRAEAAVQAEEKKQRELQSRLSQHRTMQEKRARMVIIMMPFKEINLLIIANIHQSSINRLAPRLL